MSTAREIIHQADTLRSEADSLTGNINKLNKAPAGRISSVSISGQNESVSLSFWSAARAVDLRACLVDAYTAAAARCIEEAEALEAQVQIVDLR